MTYNEVDHHINFSIYWQYSNPSMKFVQFFKNLSKLYGSFLWIGFHPLKTVEELLLLQLQLLYNWKSVTYLQSLSVFGTNSHYRVECDFYGNFNGLFVSVF